MLCRIRGVWSKLKRLCEQKAEVTRQETKATPSSLSSPIHCAKDDELNFNPKVRKLAKELRELELMGRSTCYGVIAPWGMGKRPFLISYRRSYLSMGLWLPSIHDQQSQQSEFRQISLQSSLKSSHDIIGGRALS